MGIGLAIVAMLSWGIGDFLIQRSARKIGDWETLFVITAFGTLVLFPLVYRNIPQLFSEDLFGLAVLIGSGLLLTVASLCIFEAFKKGKLSILEPILSFEIPAASILAFVVLGDQISLTQVVLIATLMIGLSLLSFREKYISKSFFLEKGIVLFFVGAFLMGAGDFFLGWGARLTDPLIANFVLSFVIATISGAALVMRGQIRKTIQDIRANRASLLVMSISDNIAWVAYAFAMSLVPIAIATGLSESSIIVAVVLGLFVNRERPQLHQKLGMVIALASAITLAAITA